MSIEFGKKIAFGGDSSVYRVGDLVGKIYNGGPLCPPVPTDKVIFYAKVTADAFAYLGQNPYKVIIDSLEYPVRVNPVSKVYEESGLAVILAPFVEGATLARSVDPANARLQLLRLSKDISQVLRVDGIEITPGNAKICSESVVVTDLCAAIRKLKPH